MKDVDLRVSGQRELRDKFLMACRAQVKLVAHLIREFMREYVVAHGAPPETGPQSGQKKGKAARP